MSRQSNAQRKVDRAITDPCTPTPPASSQRAPNSASAEVLVPAASSSSPSSAHALRFKSSLDPQRIIIEQLQARCVTQLLRCGGTAAEAKRFVQLVLSSIALSRFGLMEHELYHVLQLALTQQQTATALPSVLLRFDCVLWPFWTHVIRPYTVGTAWLGPASPLAQSLSKLKSSAASASASAVPAPPLKASASNHLSPLYVPPLLALEGKRASSDPSTAFLHQLFDPIFAAFVRVHARSEHNNEALSLMANWIKSRQSMPFDSPVDSHLFVLRALELSPDLIFKVSAPPCDSYH